MILRKAEVRGGEADEAERAQKGEVTHDVCHYPDTERVLHTEGTEWRIERADGTLLESGQCKSPPGRD